MSGLLKFTCPFSSRGCSTRFRSQAGRTNHIRTFHTNHNIVNLHQANVTARAGQAAEFDPFLSQNEDEQPPSPDVPGSQADSEATNLSPHLTRNRIYHPHLTGAYSNIFHG